MMMLKVKVKVKVVVTRVVCHAGDDEDDAEGEGEGQGRGGSYTLAQKLFLSAIADFSTMLTTDTDDNFRSLIRALFKSISLSRTDNRSWVQKTYSAMRAFARCQWSPLAQPLPFASTFKQREILGCTRPRQVTHSHHLTSPGVTFTPTQPSHHNTVEFGRIAQCDHSLLKSSTVPAILS